jgi:ribosomal protein S12 methylthiotransferase
LSSIQCGFIESAKKEAIDTILAMAEYKAPKGKCSFLIVTGCLAQRYAADIRRDLPEVDEVIGTSHYQDIARSIRISLR